MERRRFFFHSQMHKPNAIYLMKTTNMYQPKLWMQSIYVCLIINAMKLNQMQILSSSLLSMQESIADTKEYEVKISNKKCTQNQWEQRETKYEITRSIKNSKLNKKTQCLNSSNKNTNNEKKKEEITQQSLNKETRSKYSS